MRRLTTRIVAPMRVSTGAVLDYPKPQKLRQLDVILWAPFPAPGIFEIDNFALVPRSSAFGLMEIKRSNYTNADKQLEHFSKVVSSLAAERNRDIGGDGRHAGLGIVCVLEGSVSARLGKLITEKKAIAIFEKETPDSVAASVRAKDVLRLVNFLHFVGWRYRMHSTQPGYPQLKTK